MSAVRPGWGMLALGLSLGLSLVVATRIVSGTLIEIKRHSQTVEVKGFAEKRIISNWATWTGAFTTRASDLAEAYALLERQREQVVAFLAAATVPEAEYELFPVTTQALFEHDEQGIVTNRIEGYELRQELRVSSADIDRVAGVSKSSDRLIKNGIEFSSFRPEYFYTKLSELKIEMLRAATADARERAQELATQSESRIGGLRSARQGVFQITPAHSTEVSDYGHNDTSSREKAIKAVVTIQYAVEN